MIMKLLVCLVVITISHCTAAMVGEHQPGAADSEITNENLKFVQELANANLPSYLKELYTNFSFPGQRSNIIKDQRIIVADTIRSYENQAKDADCTHYKFNVDKTSIDGEEIIHAELRLLQKISMPGDYYEVNIHYLLNNNNIDSPLKLTFKHIDSSSGWKTFDVTPIVESWKQGWVNYGLKVTLTKEEQQLSCEGVYSAGDQEDILNTEPLLVVFTRDNTNKFSSEVLKDKGISNIHHKRVRRAKEGIKVIHSSCVLNHLNIRNTDVVLNDIHMMLPLEFDIGICGGHCTRLSRKSLKIIDHSTIVNLYFGERQDDIDAPKRCCIETGFEKMAMVFHNDVTKEIIYKNEPVKATSCGCM